MNVIDRALGRAINLLVPIEGTLAKGANEIAVATKMQQPVRQAAHRLTALEQEWESAGAREAMTGAQALRDLSAIVDEVAAGELRDVPLHADVTTALQLLREARGGQGAAGVVARLVPPPRSDSASARLLIPA